MLFDLPYNCIGIAKNPLPKGWSQKVSTSCTIIDAEYTVLSKGEDNINGESGEHSDETFEDFTE